MRRTVSRFPQFRPRASAMRIALLQAGLLFAIAPLAYAVDQHEASPIGGKQGGKRVASLPKTVVQGQADDGYAVREVSVIKTATPLINVAQSISVVSAALMRDTATQNMADVVRYVPGVGIAQGEGNRDTPIFRGSASTADFFVDGIRDDVQYFRDIYNIERVEALKGPNAMLFGRGGSGGLINRVSKQADGSSVREASLLLGSWDNRRATVDFGQAINDTAAFRVAGLVENSASYRDGFSLERWGLNPTLALNVSDLTTVVVGYEHFHDERIADRGVPSYLGRPLQTDPSTFFGNPAQSPTNTTVDAFQVTLTHEFGDGVALHNQTRVADYDKFYQNVFPGPVNSAGTMVRLTGYSNATQRSNLINQTNLNFRIDGGSLQHDLLVGAEIGRQETDNLRQTGYFSSISSSTTSIEVPVSAPITTLPMTWAQSATDADNSSTAEFASLYVQDQIEFTPQLLAVLGLRYDHLQIDVRNHRNGSEFSATDTPLSPRAGLIYKPLETVSIYANYSLAYQPRAGEQLSSLSLSNQALDPEQFESFEVGAKWDVNGFLSATAALYRLDRSNVAITDPADPTRSILIDGQRTEGFELGVTGELTDAWQIVGGYAHQDGEVLRNLSATTLAGARLAQLPEHSISLWNRYSLTSHWSFGIGSIYRSESFTSTDNLVRLPGYARFDGAVFFSVNDNLQVQLNIENLFDKQYFPNAHSNNNITPGSPLAVRLGLTARF